LKLPLIIYGDGSQKRDFINVKDVAGAILASTKNKSAEGQVFNIGSGEPTSINDLAKTVIELAGGDLEITHAKFRAGDIKNSYSDISKAKKLLDFEPKISLREGLQILFDEKMVAT
jgi:UDP-glucose 4-epimerase